MAESARHELWEPDDPTTPDNERILWFLLSCSSSNSEAMGPYEKFEAWATAQYGEGDLPPVAEQQMFLAQQALLAGGLRWLAETVENGMVDTVYNLRAQDISWERIAELTGVTKSAAHQRYASVIRDRTSKIVAKKPRPSVTIRFGKR
jgi:hypothetical protein